MHRKIVNKLELQLYQHHGCDIREGLHGNTGCDGKGRRKNPGELHGKNGGDRGSDLETESLFPKPKHCYTTVCS